jgi:MoxR-like ATPase
VESPPSPRQILANAADNVERVVVGKRREIELALAALLAKGHVLIEDVPGVGKTVLAKALARSFGGTFKRIQFTPDLLPSDVTGVSIYNQRSAQFEFRPGPVFANVVLADEINRATPKAQSSLLEAMEERQVSVEGETRPLPRPFLVLATQNPVELEGTFPLPEAQLDRFLVRVALGYPTVEEERAILRRFRLASPLEELAPVVSADELVEAQRACRGAHVAESVEGYLLAIVRATRDHPGVELGASPRASLALYRAAQALAAIRGRGFVVPDDVKCLAPAVLTHRLIVASGSRLRGRDRESIVAMILEETPVPVEDVPAGPPTANTHHPTPS